MELALNNKEQKSRVSRILQYVQKMLKFHAFLYIISQL